MSLKSTIDATENFNENIAEAEKQASLQSEKVPKVSKQNKKSHDVP